MSSTHKVEKTAVGDMPVPKTPAQYRMLLQQGMSDISVQILQNCLNCIEWQKGTATEPEGCRRYRQLPPPHVIVHGCEQHTFDIPF
ncbi:hypothetical protein Axy20_001 [Achromobacter phage vB_AxyS_19-32_Axy20]|nr:hypothetical protein Axy18_001 [Achromobacter phage vB_AxyS_19-32_Axy18]QDH84462.1 hypothetical protein Axy19_001 [Achromobacter phage vB_AxyS_19-32_Axy19]QDH84527.1 hypothetical protein Axy20_001 [Achromobacter phage vB_AxyS_19-32_Axy20]WNO48611.1 hypothetical protein [Achromobacter phage shaaii_LB5]